MATRLRQAALPGSAVPGGVARHAGVRSGLEVVLLPARHRRDLKKLVAVLGDRGTTHMTGSGYLGRAFDLGAERVRRVDPNRRPLRLTVTVTSQRPAVITWPVPRYMPPPADGNLISFFIAGMFIVGIAAMKN